MPQLKEKSGDVADISRVQLPALIFPVLTGFAFSIAYGFIAAAGAKVHWFALVFAFNYGIFVFVSVLVTTTTYAVEAMTHRAGAALVVTVGAKNLLAFGSVSWTTRGLGRDLTSLPLKGSLTLLLTFSRALLLFPLPTRAATCTATASSPAPSSAGCSWLFRSSSSCPR